MEFLSNGFTLDAPTGVFPISTDSMLLAHFARLPKNARVLDLGSGCGTLGVLLCAGDSRCAVTGIEIDPAAHNTALENIRRNGLEGRLHSICGDLRHVSAGQFDCCLSNPPYYSGGPASKETPAARREDHCSPADLLAAAGRHLKFGGDFFVVHKPERLAELIAWGAKENLEAKRLLLVRHKQTSAISLILLSLRKGAKPGLQIDEAVLFHEDNTPTDFYKSVYHMP